MYDTQKTTLANPQCNASVDVFTKTEKKYLESFIDETTLDWENLLLALMLAHNTSYQSTIATMPFELLFGFRPCCLQFPILTCNKFITENPTLQKDFYFLKKL
jgi:hypothetical protein